MCKSYNNDKKGAEDMSTANEEQKQKISTDERKKIIKKASKAINKEYAEAFKMISKN